ncbi:predicted protein [Histoplasma capsulatum var. duboisii H88]|uniref:Predicted protein n=2 Tax=Ajellomyces capsulatus TaxID=5037 RepID=F0UVF6_AJEC8|nr:predicted protein [Histoplasma capsulatum H143]EGC49883.1 predicted protein [Histoplasma capsulatum var. duboisii H88]
MLDSSRAAWPGIYPKLPGLAGAAATIELGHNTRKQRPNFSTKPDGEGGMAKPGLGGGKQLQGGRLDEVRKVVGLPPPASDCLAGRTGIMLWSIACVPLDLRL